LRRSIHPRSLVLRYTARIMAVKNGG
jgi:hypothetical protein